MIKLTLNEDKINIKNRFDEITLSEFDLMIDTIVNGNGIHSMISLIESFCDKEINLLELSLETYLEILSNFFTEDFSAYNTLLEYKEYKIKFKKKADKTELDLNGKQASQLEKVYKTKIEDKSSMIISILFAGEYNEELFKQIRNEKAHHFITLINMINPIKINIQ